MRIHPMRSALRALLMILVLVGASLRGFPASVAPTWGADVAAAALNRQDGWASQSIPELVQVVQILRGFERTRQQLGIQDPERTAGLGSLEHELRARIFWDVVFPHLLEAERDCAF